MAAPAPALSDNNDCVLAESAETGRVPLTEEAAIQSEASSVPEWGAGQRKEWVMLQAMLPAAGMLLVMPPEILQVVKRKIEPPVVVAAPVPALSDSDCVLDGPKF